MAKQKKYIGSKSEYTVSYRDMLGVDFSSDGFGISTRRFAHLENMYRDYEGVGAALTESIPGFRKILETNERINGIYSRCGKDANIHVVVHAGSHLYTFRLDMLDSAKNATPIFELTDKKSHARAFADTLYVFDTDGIVAVNDDGACRVSDDSAHSPYVPTTFVNGEEYEQRNLLSEKFYERTFIGSCSDFGHGTRGFSYEILSDADGYAILTSGGEASGSIYIPSSVRINGRLYTVAEISSRAFRDNTAITALTISEGVKKIGKQAFFGCTSLVSVSTPDTIEELCTSAFEGCTALSYFHLGAGMKKYGARVFADCTSLAEIRYALNLSSYTEIENTAEYTNLTTIFNSESLACAVEIPIYTPTKSILGVSVDNDAVEYKTFTENGYIRAIIIESENKHTLQGKDVVVSALVSDENPYASTASPDVLTLGANISAKEAIYGCTVSESFDGRIFVSGNPKLPNTVFYTARDDTGKNNPLYFGSLNYFNDGVGGYTVCSLLATSNMLAVFKSGDDGCGSIFYHTPKDSDIGVLPKIYPTAYVHSGICAKGASISFYDDPLFISSLGICALEKQSINLDRSIVCRSHNVNARLLAERHEEISLAEWCGYLVVLAGENAYLADSRSTFTHSTGGIEYEWYFLTGLGTYKNDERVYRYSSVAHEGFSVHSDISKRADGLIYSTDINGERVFYVTDGERRYEVEPTEEMRGGVFSPATRMLGIYGYLIFGTESGDLCVFNNDMRGVAPKRIASMPDFDADEYRKRMGRRIHTDFYSFANHAPRYALMSAFDNCGIPHLTKNTVKNSLTVKCRTLGGASLICEVGTDTSGYRELTEIPGGDMDFTSLDFSAICANTSQSFTIPISEREKGWIEKQIAFYSDEYASPFGIYSVSYRFTVKGRIKKQ